MGAALHHILVLMPREGEGWVVGSTETDRVRRILTRLRGEPTMRCGLFTELQCPQERQESQLYDELLEQIVQAETLGYAAMWMAELHFHRRFSILSAPLLTAAAAAQRTQRLRLGIAVNLLPLHHPVRLAEEGAVLDVLSHGRLDFGVGRGTHFLASMKTFASRQRRAVSALVKRSTS